MPRSRTRATSDSRSMMLCQLERAGVEIEVDPQRLAEALDNKAKNG